jgi:Metal-dependent hydrolases of the beta-lactamase superfamily I
MPLFISSIASGSNGNCYYIGNECEAILVDAGISCRETEKRMTRLGLSMKRVKAIFVSHEHSDHIKGLSVLANKYQLPVFLTEGTRRSCKLAIPERLLHPLADLEAIRIGELVVTSFRKFHDAADPHSFIIQQGEHTVGVFTDIGRVCERVTDFFRRCDAAFLETNYDEDMLMRGRYPFFLKNRIRGGLGHLSNTEALELFLNHRSDRLNHIFLSHLSRDNNDPELVAGLFDGHRGDTEVIVAGRYAETPVYGVGAPTIIPYSLFTQTVAVGHGS